ncbi:MAG: hypothetical protein K2P51_08760 [Rhabdochlamydiaceae bacterium]|nr:hypothetical protein [Rhabdochlamydiaceae bacterium]
MTSSFFSELESFLEKNPQYHPHTSDPDLEHDLEQALSKEDLKSLGLAESALFPILRRLPRMHLQTDPEKTRIKSPFRSLPHLKRLLITKALAQLYLCYPIENPFSMILFTWVIADGWGDYYTQKHIARLLSNTYPHLNLTLVTLIHEEKQIPSETEWNEIILRYSGEINQPINYQPFSKHLCTQFQAADLVLEAPTPFLDLFRYAAREKTLRIGEHSALRSYPYHPRTGAYSMGLHFLETGILCKELTTERCFHEGQFSMLYEKSYWDTHTFNCGYTKTIRSTYLYLLTLCHLLRKTPKDCDICMLHMPHLSVVLDKYFTTPASRGSQFLLRCSVKEIQIYEKGKCTHIPIAEKGKLLRLYATERLSQSEAITLMKFSQHLIGCTGDQSLLEAIATKIPFFYDPPPLKRQFLSDLHWIASSRISERLAKFFDLQLNNPDLPLGPIDNGWISEEDLRICSDRLSLHEDTEEKIAISLANHLENPNLSSDFKTLHEILQTEYAFEPFLLGLINRTWLHLRNPALAAFESQEINAFATGGQNGKTTLGNIIHKLREIKK